MIIKKKLKSHPVQIKKKNKTGKKEKRNIKLKNNTVEDSAVNKVKIEPGEIKEEPNVTVYEEQNTDEIAEETNVSVVKENNADSPKIDKKNKSIFKKTKNKKANFKSLNKAGGDGKEKTTKRSLEETDFIDSDVSHSDNEEYVPKKKKKKDDSVDNKKIEDSPEVKERTIFVGNVPLKCTKKAVKQHFRKYGKIESIRVRGIPVANPGMPKKVAVIKQEFHPERDNVICYIKYVHKEDALKAEAENGALFEGHHLRVTCCGTKNEPDETKAIFVGNLSFDATEEELWKTFEDCGPISHVRIIRDAFTGMGKGFAYVNFKETDGVQLALEMEDVKLKDRVLRISLCNTNAAKKNKKMNKQKEITKPGEPRHFRRRFNRHKPKNNTPNEENHDVQNDRKKVQFKPKKGFQGSKFTDKKKKLKKDKGMMEKKKKIESIAPKSE